MQIHDLTIIARQFFKIDQWHGATPIGNGNINDTYRIDFDENGATQTFVLQRLNQEVFRQPESVMANISRVMAHLAAAPDYPLVALAPRLTLTGKLLHRDAMGNHWRVYPYLADTISPDTVATPEAAHEAATAYGAFARALRDFPPTTLVKTIPGFHDTDRRWIVFEEVLAKNTAKRAVSVKAEIKALRAAKPIFNLVGRLKAHGALPLRVTHNDTKAGNVLLNATTGKAVAVIDLDTVMPGSLLSDFGDMVRTFVPDRYEDDPDTDNLTMRTDILDALTEGFLAQTSDFLTAGEREHLLLGARWMIGEQALRFLSDYLAGDVYYKIQYPEHNLVRARNQLAVFKNLLPQ